MKSPSESFKIDMRVRRCQTRHVRDGVALLSQHKTDIEELDGTITLGEWETLGSFTNYGDVFDPKPSWWRRLLSNRHKKGEP